MSAAPLLDDIREAHQQLEGRVRRTPLWRWTGREIEEGVAEGTRVITKLELLQLGGTFKPRGALLNVLAMDDDARGRGVTAVSAGNHAIAVAIAARAGETHAKVVMPQTADPFRIEACKAWGAEVVLTEDVHAAFAEVERIRDEEGRTFIHPFESERTVLGTATLGLEWMEQDPELDALVVPIGGGGLIAGIASAVKQLEPDCPVYGVEPEGADSMRRSLEAGSPQALERVRTVADSLGAPKAMPYTFDLCRELVDEVVTVTDAELVAAMRRIHAGLKFAVEPACAAATAGLTGPLRGRLAGRRVGVLLCGSNIGADRWCEFVAGQ